MPSAKPKRLRRPTSPTLLGLSIRTKLDFMSGIALPPRTAFEASRSTFQSYREYLDLYRQVRVQVMERWPDYARFFAEKLYQQAVAQPQADVEKLGAKLHDRLQRSGRC
jgi:hypothetical protein